MNLRVVALGEAHDLAGFASGNLELDGWLQHHARQATGRERERSS